MRYHEFMEFVEKDCMHEAIYDDSEGRRILVIRLLDAYLLANDYLSKEKANETTNTTEETASRRQVV
jgi:hypothetical protein